MLRKHPPIVIPKKELVPKERAPILPTRAIEDKRSKTGRHAKHKKKEETAD